MKTADTKTTTTTRPTAAGPFFRKAGDRAAASAEEKAQPFFAPVQAKLTIGAPNDPYEREADQMADRVVQRLADNRSQGAVGEAPLAQASYPFSISRLQRKPIFETEPVQAKPAATPAIQRKCAACAAEEEQPAEEETGKVQRKCAACAAEEDKAVVQRKADGAASVASDHLESRLNSTKGGGASLPEDTRGSMESAFGADFSGVRVHTDSAAVQMNKELGAQAFTHGNNVYFNEGKYSPSSSSGQRLLAHELVHVVQQDIGVKKKIEGVGNSTSFCPRTAEERTQSKPHGELSQKPASMSCNFDLNFSNNDGEFNFLQGSSDVSRIAASLDSFKKRWNLTGANSEVTLHGFASVEGCEDRNWILSCQRALNVKAALEQPCTDGSPGIISSAIHIFAQGETNRFSLENLAGNRVVKISSAIPPTPLTKTLLKVTVKSFIAPIGSRIGSLPFRCRLFDWTRPAGSAAPDSQARLQALAVATDLMMSENPTNDAKDKGYRLFTSRTFSVLSDQGQILSVFPSELDTDVGMELFLQPPQLLVLNDHSHRDSNSFSFSWKVKGRPHLAAEPGFQGVCPRVSFYIWHDLSGQIKMIGGVPTITNLLLLDSRFPSDRVFVNNVAQFTHPQEGFARLWFSSSAEPTLVE